jgi:hypothetical protein
VPPQENFDSTSKRIFMAYWGYTLGAGGAEKSPRKFPIQPSPSPRCNLRELRLDGQRAQCKGEKKKEQRINR